MSRGIVSDIAWSILMLVVRRRRRKLGFAERLKFDDAFRPRLKKSEFGRGKPVIAYPDAAYHATWADYRRATLPNQGSEE